MTKDSASVEERLGTIKGILSPLPSQLQDIYSKLSKIRIEQEGLHTGLDRDVGSIVKDANELDTDFKDLKKVVDGLSLSVRDINKMIKSQEESKSFFKQHAMTFIVSLTVGVVVGLVGYFLKGK